MIIAENIRINGKEFIRHSSDKGVMIRKTGTNEMYSEAVDIIPCSFAYEETDYLIGNDEDEINDRR